MRRTRPNIKIADIEIKNVFTERRINGNTSVEGSCRVVLDDDDFSMDFSYTGCSNEPSSKIYDYLLEAGYQKYIRLSDKKPETLLDFASKKSV